MSEKIKPFMPDSICSRSLVKMLSIKVAVCWVILVGLLISGKKDEVRSCSQNLFESSQLSVFRRSMLKSPIKYVIFFVLSTSESMSFSLFSNISKLPLGGL
jgi:hypothetical protein